MVQRLFQEEPEHVGSEQMKDAGGEVTQGHLLEHHQGVRQITFSFFLCGHVMIVGHDLPALLFLSIHIVFFFLLG